MKIALFFNQSLDDLIFYGGLIIGAILFVWLLMKLLGYEENQNDMNTDYVDDDEFWQGGDDDF
ncbi:MAG: hypothetical protein JXR05_08785 [Flavobacteriaceae bacterium]